MQKLKNVSDPIIIDGHRFVVKSGFSGYHSVYFISATSDTPYFIDYLYCNSKNIYYIRRRARHIIKNFISHYREK